MSKIKCDRDKEIIVQERSKKKRSRKTEKYFLATHSLRPRYYSPISLRVMSCQKIIFDPYLWKTFYY